MLHEGAAACRSCSGASATGCRRGSTRRSTKAPRFPTPTIGRAMRRRDDAIAALAQWLSEFDAVISPPATGAAPDGLDATGDPACCTLWSLVGFPAITIPIGLARQRPAARDADRGAAPGADDRCSVSRPGARAPVAVRGARSEAREKAARDCALPKPRNPVARSPLCTRAARTARPRAAKRRREKIELAKLARDSGCPRMKRWPKNADTLCRSDLEQGRMRDIYLAAVDAGRALNDEQLSTSLTETLARRPKGAGWWVFAYGSLLWNPLFPVAEMRPASLRGLASPLLPVVARVARHADAARPRAGPRSRRRVPRRGVAAAGAAGARRIASPLATRNGRRRLRSAMGAARRRRARARRARLRRAPRPSAVRGSLARGARGRRHRQRARCVRRVGRLSRAHARGARVARHRRSLSRNPRRARRRHGRR